MQIADILRPENVILGLEPNDKAWILQELAQSAARATGLDAGRVLAVLQNREAFGSTGIGNGVAIPHASLPGLARPFGLFVRLTEPLDFGSIDGVGVDLVFLLLMPEADHAADLGALSAIARRLRAPGVLAELRSADTSQAVFASLTGIS